MVDGAMGDVTSTVCYNSCAACGMTTVRFRVDMSNEDVSPFGVHVAGEFQDWDPAATELMDPDGDMVYETVQSFDATGLSEIQFKFINGNTWADPNEVIDGACGNASGNRVLTVDSENILLSANESGVAYCYNSCSACDGTGGAGGAEEGDITFQVDLSEYTGAYAMVNLNGSFNGWCGTCAEMTDDDGDNIYELTIEAMPAGTIEYKFTLDRWAVAEEFAGGEPCTLTTGEYVNRVYEVTGDATLEAVCWNVCTLCNAEPVPGCTDATACNYNADATEDDGSCVYGEGPNAGFSVMDALCHDGMGSVMLDSATVDIAGATFSVGGMAIENGMMDIAAGTHMLVATGADGCSNETEFTVNAPEELVIEVTLVSQDSGAGDGQASA
ncbi:MAG TPA: hypothetical protein DCL98_03060, partial [Flavobacteriales bacterium]|nr:hypothetical protein [Flavobacteriales bacterium]